jgi:cellulose biosynthesis protein BcsQ
MIQISNAAKKIQNFLENKKIERFKIFIRITFQIDVFIFSSDPEEAIHYQEEFLSSLNNEDDKLAFSNYKITFNTLPIESLDDPYYASIAQGENGIDPGPRYSLNSLFYEKKENPDMENLPPIVTFYSYKGGMGRTTTMMAYAIDLVCNQKKRVVVIDCDLEAPGYLNFFNLSKHEDLVKEKVNGLVEFMCDLNFAKENTSLDINKYAINAAIKNDNLYKDLDKLWILPAGNLNSVFHTDVENPGTTEYLEGLSRINLSNTNMQIFAFKYLFKKINEAYAPDIILIDSRTGFNDIFGTLALILSKHVVGFFGFNKQTLPGISNLLKEYYNPQNKFSLNLIFSILPQNANEQWVNKHDSEIQKIIARFSSVNTNNDAEKDRPKCIPLRRNTAYETIGTDDELSDKNFIDSVKNKSNSDYDTIFGEINSVCFSKQDSLNKQNCEDQFDNVIENKEGSISRPAFNRAIDLRNVVLKHLKTVLADVKKFAEDTENIDEKYFFYRECMKEFFNPSKFLIQGYKGTGKTYLYTALVNKNISSNIRNWAKEVDPKSIDATKHSDYFINILPVNGGGSLFDDINYNHLEDPKYYFNRFWQIYTWNVLLLNDDFKEIRNQSRLSEYIKDISGSGDLARFEDLIEKKETLAVIEEDFKKLNEFLKRDELDKKIFIMYDRLDTCINPIRWSKAISPLINFWWKNLNTYDHLSPKIFVRTDLFKQIEGTNTDRLSENIVSIEWTMGEVFGYLFKLIFADNSTKQAFWEILRRINDKYESVIKRMEKQFSSFPYNQLREYRDSSIARAEMGILISAFFGKEVRVGKAHLGSPWDYFSKELSNADNSAISLRPFINTLDRNAIDEALKYSAKWIHVILSSEIYANKEVREQATTNYFKDLTSDDFSKDLVRFKDVIRTSGGEMFRFKSLSEKTFEDLIDATIDRINAEGGSDVIKSKRDLKNMIFANGIMAEKITTKGRFYTFAPIYWYSWGLANSILENEDAHNTKNKKQSDILHFGKLVWDSKNGSYVVKDDEKNWTYPIANLSLFISRYPIKEGLPVTYTVQSEPNLRNPSKSFYKATNIKPYNEEDVF